MICGKVGYLWIVKGMFYRRGILGVGNGALQGMFENCFLQDVVSICEVERITILEMNSKEIRNK